MKNNFIKKYIKELNDSVILYTAFKDSKDADNIYSIISRCLVVLGKELNIDDNAFAWKTDYAVNDALILIDILEYNLNDESDKKINDIQISEDTQKQPIIFLSHNSKNKNYGHAIRDFIVGLGVKDNQLIYTSHPLHKIPLDANIYDYLRKNIYSNIFMIILWSDEYLESPACLNEMGAAWVVQSDYTNIYVPTFSFGNPKYHQCAVDTQKMGAVLNGDEHCKASLIELKEKIVNMFNLAVDEKRSSFLVDELISKIKE